MIASLGWLVIGFVLSFVAAAATEARQDRQRELAELARHQALPPLPVPWSTHGEPQHWRNN